MRKGITSAMILGFFLGIVTAHPNAVAGETQAPETTRFHETLRLENHFSQPEKVVEYYCARDAQGFVWSGLLQGEIQAFTTWDEAPQSDSFYIAKGYKVLPNQRVGHNPNHVTVEVQYDLRAIGDANGTRVPAPNQDFRITFDLRKVNGRWKINLPLPHQISPVVLESRFASEANRTGSNRAPASQ